MGNISGRSGDVTKRRSKQEKFVKVCSDLADQSDETEPMVCKIEHSPYHILRLAARGTLTKFKKYLCEEPTKIGTVDQKGKSAVHHAAENNQIEILDFILSKGAAIDQVDEEGNTALHLSVIAGKQKAVQTLLQHGARADIYNNRKYAPIHEAVDHNKADMIEAMAGFEQVDMELQLRVTKGTPLHMAAFKDAPDAARALLNAGSTLEPKCAIGMKPFHLAAKQGSKATMKVILDYADSHGISTCPFLKTTDRENSNPLHAAVSSGDCEVVQMCMKAGGDICTQQDDKSTPVHLACAKGALQMVKAMLEFERKCTRNKDCLNSRDAMEMTPLHHAAMFDHAELCQYLLDEGADIDAQDNEMRTPLYLTANKMAMKSMCVLLTRGANVYVNDKTKRNFLHAAVLSNCRLDQLGCSINKHIKNLLNETDDNGCTPLHYASQMGLLSSMETLITIGAVLNPKNNERESPLHFAASYGRYNSCRKLLNSKGGAQLINENDGQYRSALHMAAENGHDKVVQLLIKKGAVVQKDIQGNNAVHLAAKNGYTRTIRTILAVHSHVLNSRGKNGNTALHLAAMGGHCSATTLLMDEGAACCVNDDEETFLDLALLGRQRDVALVIVKHDRWREVFEARSKIYHSYTNGFITQLPEVCSVVFDRLVTVSRDENGNQMTHYCFRHLQMSMDNMLARRKNGEPYSPLISANNMVRHNRVELLNHPLIVRYLNMKWKAYGLQIFIINLLIYAVFLGALTYFVTNFPTWKHADASQSNNTTLISPFNHYEFGYNHKFAFHSMDKISHVIIIVFCILNMIKEVGQMVQQRSRYFLDATNLLEWILYISCTIFIAPSLIMDFSTHFQWECGAIATFLSWVNLLLFFQRTGRFGIYVVMFLEILRTLLEVLLVFFVLIVAFGLAFYILLNSKEHTESRQASVGMIILRSIMMMLGDYDFKESFLFPFTDGDPDTLHFGNLTMLLLVVFVLLMPILLMNLLIGLAVGDIESIQRNAKLKRIAMQVALHTDLERKLPAFILRRVDKVEETVIPCKARQRLTHKVLSKISGGLEGHYADYDEEAGRDSYLYEEMFKQKRKIKDVSQTIEKTFDLVRLIVQKMEIAADSEDIDEGFNPSDSWQEALKKHKLQLTVLTKLKKS